MNYGRFKARPTKYRDVMFKSGLEARVAEAFDNIGLAWEYEPFCFRGQHYVGGQYTPDFHLPEMNAYVEVAGVLDDRHVKNARTFIRSEPVYRGTCHGSGDGIRPGQSYYAIVDGDGDFRDVRSDDGAALIHCGRCGRWSFVIIDDFPHCPYCAEYQDVFGYNIFDVAGMERPSVHYRNKEVRPTRVAYHESSQSDYVPPDIDLSECVVTDDVQGSFNRIVDVVSRQDPTIGPLLTNVSSVRIMHESLVITLGSDAYFAERILCWSNRCDKFKAAARDAFGVNNVIVLRAARADC